ncbi:MAG: CBS domain-containing protein [Candidatus Promineifilaceae bacterium]|nr:CBS domain-containing protein [Candidatus Promineifilaceae bacterium]
MEVIDLMTPNPACCTQDTNLQAVAQMMKENDCGMIPVVDSMDNMNPIGTVSDRDITIRCVAEGKNPLDATAGDIMSQPVVTVHSHDTVVDTARKMEENMVRRIPVVDENNSVVGIVAQADLALQARKNQAYEVVQEVSKPTTSSSTV